MRRHLLRRLHTILEGDDRTGAFKSLDPETRRSIRAILSDTLTDLPAYWNL